MPDGNVSRDEVYALFTAMRSEQSAGFARLADGISTINAHLARLNGQTAKHAEAIAENSARLRSLERERDDDEEDDADHKPITRRELYVGLTCAGSAFAVVKVLPWLLQLAQVKP